MSENVISLKEYIERQIAARAADDAEFLVRVMVDPDSVIKPLIAEAIGDDGGTDLLEVKTTVHVETPTNLHFVLKLEADELPGADVVGFGAFDLSAALRIGTIDLGGLGPDAARVKSASRKRCCTVSDPCYTSDAAGCGKDQSTVVELCAVTPL